MDPVNINAHFMEIGVSFATASVRKNSKAENM
jgi:hypothetical protein